MTCARTARIGHGYVSNDGGLDPDTGQGVASSHWHQGSASAQSTVDAETGVISTQHALRLLVRRQGGQQARCRAAERRLDDHRPRDRPCSRRLQFADGQLTNPNLSDYNIASALDWPRSGTVSWSSPVPRSTDSARPPCPPVPPAIGNAVASLGYDVRTAADDSGTGPRGPPDRRRDHSEPHPASSTAAPSRSTSSPRRCSSTCCATEVGLTGPRVDLRRRAVRHLHRAARRRARLRLHPDGTPGQGKEITTVEGLPDDDQVMACFDKHHAFQCGFCIPGMVLTARDMVDQGHAATPRGDPGRARRQPVPLRLLREDHRGHRGGRVPVKYVTYETRRIPRVGYLDGDDGRRRRLRRRHGRLHRGRRAAIGTGARRSPAARPAAHRCGPARSATSSPSRAT